MEVLAFVVAGPLLVMLVSMAIARRSRRTASSSGSDGVAPWFVDGSGGGADCSADAGGCDGGGGGGD